LSAPNRENFKTPENRSIRLKQASTTMILC
jgi:hypothetical protein